MISFVLGCRASFLYGWIGMMIVVKTNVKTAHPCWTSLGGLFGLWCCDSGRFGDGPLTGLTGCHRSLHLDRAVEIDVDPRRVRQLIPSLCQEVAVAF